MLPTCLLIGSALAQELPSVATSPDSGLRSRRDAVVVLGVQDYNHLPDVPYAIADAAAAQSWLIETWGPSRSRTVVQTDPSNRGMRDALERGLARVRPGGTLWITFSGNGRVVDGEPYLLGSDAHPDSLANGVSLKDLQEQAARSRADRVFILVDASFDDGARDELAPTPSRGLDWGDNPDDKVVLWVGDERGGARALEPAGQGLFTYLALGALQGWGDLNSDGEVTLSEAQTWVQEATRALGRPQRPTTSALSAPWVVSGPKLRDDTPSAQDLLAWGREDLQRRIAVAERRVQEAAEEALLETLAAISTGQAPPESLERFIEQWSQARVQVEWVPPLTVIDEARQLLADADSLVPAQPVEGAVVDSGDSGEPDAPALSNDRCDDMMAMEPDALMGRFSPGRIACIEARMEKAPQTDQDKLSRLLMANAEAKGDTQEWARLMERHLADITQSDPDLCFLYALYLYKQGVASSEEAIVWANKALENKQVWTGEIYKARVSSLYRLRTEAAAELWQDAEQNLVAEPSAQADALTSKWRGATLDYAREWLDYTRAAGAPSDRALSLCVSAAGTMGACEEN